RPLARSGWSTRWSCYRSRAAPAGHRCHRVVVLVRSCLVLARVRDAPVSAAMVRWDRHAHAIEWLFENAASGGNTPPSSDLPRGLAADSGGRSSPRGGPLGEKRSAGDDPESSGLRVGTGEDRPRRPGVPGPFPCLRHILPPPP